LNSLPGAGGTGEHTVSGPAVLANNGSLYILAFGSFNGPPQPGPVNILRINTSTGQEQNRLPLGTPPLLTGDLFNPMPNSFLAVDSSSNVFFGGLEGIRSYTPNLQTLRWSNTQLVARAAVLDAANNVYVTGYVPNGSGGYDFDVKRLNNSNGTQVWDDEFNGQPQSFEELRGGNALALDSRGQLYAAGAQTISGNNLYKIDPATGNITWFLANGADANMGVTVGASDYVYVVGTTAAVGDPSGVALINVYDPQGNLLWNQSYSAANSGDVFNTVALDKNGGVYCIGKNFYSGTLYPTLVKYTERRTR
jgi:hypothetical protein